MMLQVIEHLPPGSVPVVLKQYKYVPQDITAKGAVAMARQESQFMTALPKTIVIIDVAGVKVGKAFWRYARALSKAPRWELPHHTHVANCPTWTVKVWKQVKKLLTKADADNVSLHTTGVSEVLQSIRIIQI